MKTAVSALKLLVAAFLLIIVFFPLYWMLNISLIPDNEVIRSKPHLFPPISLITLKAYKEAIVRFGLFTPLFNSVVIVFCATAITLALSFPVAYSLAKYTFRWKTFVHYLIIWFLALPWIVYVLPIFKIVSSIGFLDKHLVMILLYGFSGIPLFAWLALPFIREFPNELIDAARLDGCSELGIVWKIAVPSLKNVFVALFLIRFIWAYNDLLFSLTFTFQKAKMIMPAILEIPGLFDLPYAKMAAGGVIAVVPILVLAIVFQNQIVSGLTGRTIK
jgi:ABC-type glycerol-3-phosphate transport system permease component